jgi:hypothetical protein
VSRDSELEEAYTREMTRAIEHYATVRDEYNRMPMRMGDFKTLPIYTLFCWYRYGWLIPPIWIAIEYKSFFLFVVLVVGAYFIYFVWHAILVNEFLPIRAHELEVNDAILNMRAIEDFYGKKGTGYRTPLISVDFIP